MIRIFPILLVLVLCISCLVFPASAATDYTRFNLLDYSSVNDSGDNYFSFKDSTTIYFDVPSKSVFRYVDMYATFSGAIPTSVTVVDGNGVEIQSLSFSKVSDRLYRVYGSLPSKAYTAFRIKFDTGKTSSSYYTIHSCYVSALASDAIPTFGTLNVWDSINGSTSVSMSDPTDEPEIYLTQDEGSTVSWAEFITTVYLDEWKKYNYIDVVLYCDVEHINSLFVRQGDLFLDYDVSYLTPADDINTYYWVMVHIDLSSCDLSSSTIPTLVLTGTYYNQVSYNKILLKSITGLLEISDPNELLNFWYNLRSFLTSNFNVLFQKIDEAFGLNNDAASSAQQTQEEINVSVNNQLVGAVEDWNANIEVVQTGYDSALTKATPALGWLASLADRVFSNMGWFGNIYFLIGLISVIMLILSKSGLARSVSRFRRNE